jgi:dUTPase
MFPATIPTASSATASAVNLKRGVRTIGVGIVDAAYMANVVASMVARKGGVVMPMEHVGHVCSCLCALATGRRPPFGH